MSASIPFLSRLSTTVARELLVAVTGLAMVGFIIMHMSGNLLIFFGPEVFNDYSAKLHAIPEVLWIARVVLLASIVLHISATASLVRANRAARSQRYDLDVQCGRKTAATRLMLLTGLMIVFFVFFHIYDFTLRAHEGPAAMLGDEEMGLYGLVWNSFANPIRSLFYLAAVACVGLHLSHAIASVLVTLGWLRESATTMAERVALGVGAGVAGGFAMVPLYVLVATYVFKSV